MSRDGGEHGPTPLGEALGSFLQKHGLDREVKGQEALSRWDETVGDRIAEVTRAAGVARGVLFVEVASSAWMSELNMMKRDILARLNAGRDGVERIERIVFRLAEGPLEEGGGGSGPA